MSETRKLVLPRQRMGEYERCPWGVDEAPKVLGKLAHRGDGPPYYQLKPGGIAYDNLDLFDAWLESHMVGSTSQACVQADAGPCVRP